MLTSTVRLVACPSLNNKGACRGALQWVDPALKNLDRVKEIKQGQLVCSRCGALFPVLAGVAILVQDVGRYLVEHAKGISLQVQDADIPEEYLDDYLIAKLGAGTEHIEEDLEANRVNALYLATHYLEARGKTSWWKAKNSSDGPKNIVDQLIRKYWDQGPMARVIKLLPNQMPKRQGSWVELGCGVGGLYRKLQSRIQNYLGVDSSFASIALARHLNLGTEYTGNLSIPGDLLEGPLARSISFKKEKVTDGSVDYVVGEVDRPPLSLSSWDGTIALNLMDMLVDPFLLPELQWTLLRAGGIAVQSCPYIWHESAALQIRERLKVKTGFNSAKAVETMYRQRGFRIKSTMQHVPWLFFKHQRQLEIYSVHMFSAEKRT